MIAALILEFFELAKVNLMNVYELKFFVKTMIRKSLDVRWDQHSVVDPANYLTILKHDLFNLFSKSKVVVAFVMSLIDTAFIFSCSRINLE